MPAGESSAKDASPRGNPTTAEVSSAYRSELFVCDVKLSISDYVGGTECAAYSFTNPEHLPLIAEQIATIN